MTSVYNLTMIDIEASYDNHIEAFNIGFFSGYENKNDAEQKLNELKAKYSRKEWCVKQAHVKNTAKQVGGVYIKIIAKQ